MGKYDSVVKGILGNKEFTKLKTAFNKMLGEKPKDTKWIEKDSDKDGVMNGLDCEPNNPKEQGFIHKTVNFVRGKGFQDIKRQTKKAEKFSKQGKVEKQRTAEKKVIAQREKIKELAKRK